MWLSAMDVSPKPFMELLSAPDTDEDGAFGSSVTPLSDVVPVCSWLPLFLFMDAAAATMMMTSATQTPIIQIRMFLFIVKVSCIVRLVV